VWNELQQFINFVSRRDDFRRLRRFHAVALQCSACRRRN
jgi:hypothetical protein